MKDALALDSLAAREEEAVAVAGIAPESLCGMLRLVRRTALAATVGGSLAILISPSVPSRQPTEATPRVEHGTVGSGATTASWRDGALERGAAAEAAEVAVTRGQLFAAVSRCRPSLSEGLRWRIADAVHHESKRHGYDPLFVMALVEVESTCSPTANSSRGAVGLTQIKPSTAREVAKGLGVPFAGRSSLVQPRLNVRLGLSYLSQLERKFGDPYVAMAAYNLGPRKAARMSRSHAKRARYVKKILARYEGLLVEHAA